VYIKLLVLAWSSLKILVVLLPPTGAKIQLFTCQFLHLGTYFIIDHSTDVSGALCNAQKLAQFLD
jgi:hypothetical protein